MTGPGVAKALNIADLRAQARRRLPRGVFGYIEGGVEDELCTSVNRAALRRLKLAPHALRNVTRIDPSVSLFGRTLPQPFAVAPVGGQGLFWHDGDVVAARAAAKAGIPYTISTASTMNLEEIAVAWGTLWFQLYMWADRALSHAAIARARSLGCEVMFVTIDLPVAPLREYNERNGYGMPFRLSRSNVVDLLTHPAWLAGVLGRYIARGQGVPRQANLPPHLRGRVTGHTPVGAAFKNDDLDWDEVKALRDRWDGKLVIKGVLRPDDAERALALGADGVVVSNHGGRALDCAPATIDVLPDIVAAVGRRMAVLFDSGVTRGSDVVKALALGADAVLVGRAMAYGLGAGGEAGVARALDLLASEVVRTMALCGCRNVGEITRELLFRQR